VAARSNRASRVPSLSRMRNLSSEGFVFLEGYANTHLQEHA
jgi:hypothetical protein